MNRSVYTLFYTLLLPLIFLRLWWRSLKDSRYRQRWRERLALYPQSYFDTSKPVLLFHVVSVGEFHVAIPLIRACMQQNPGWTLTVTSTTITGSARVQEVFGDTVQHCYLPCDTTGAVRRFLQALQPRVMLLMETELWPNLIHYSQQRGCHILLLNARLSEKSFRKYRKHAALTQSMLLELDKVAAQFEQDAEYFRQLGLPAHALEVAGTMKFDQQVDAGQVKAAELFRQSLGRPVFVAGSTRAGEEIKMLEAFRLILQAIPDTLLILVPRHPDRLAEVKALLREQQWTFVLHSSKQSVSKETQVMLGDTMGEMQYYFACADAAFVGGSLVNTGGQNMIEAALVGVPVFTGPSCFNFQAVSALMQAAGALVQVNDARELADRVQEIIQDKDKAAAMIAAASEVLATQAGASARQLALIQQAIHSGQ